VYKSESAAYGGNSLKSDFGGHDNLHHDNLDLFYSQGYGIVQQLPGHADSYVNNILYLDPGKTGALSYGGGQVCTATPTAAQSPVVGNNTLWVPAGVTINECGMPLAQYQAAGGDVGTTVAAWPADAEVLAVAKTVLGMV
jgi:hypothetical protein